jgi:N-methylhydantoinase A/oxoprolinase/acetone carboxylase beta subunit
MITYLLGVDTGGTYTDAAILRTDTRTVVATAKALTTKGDLAIGVTEAITLAVAKLPGTIHPEDIALVSVSTTLATNAVVEGHGGAVAAILIGFDADMVTRTGIAKAFPDLPIVCVPGGHDHNGNELCALDTLALRSVVEHLPVEAFAVASQFAVRNPAHELAAAAALETLGRPVTLSSELSSTLDAPRRALTSVLNARLIARISGLVAAVQKSMAGLGIDCPLMVVRGDGTLATATTVALRPIETVLSGPAASMVGAAWLSGLSDFILSDMGGTTTDLGLFIDGRPRTAPDGAEVGGWRTTVRAIDVTTVGLGGDSEVLIGTRNDVTLSPQRVVPLSLLAARFPEVLTMLAADLADAEISSLHGKFLVLPFGHNGSAPQKQSAHTTGRLSAASSEPLSEPLSRTSAENSRDSSPEFSTGSMTESFPRSMTGSKAGSMTGSMGVREAEILRRVATGPISARHVLKVSGGARTIAKLIRSGHVVMSALTPSDAAHVLGLQENWSTEGAQLGASISARLQTMRTPTEAAVTALCQSIWDATVSRSAEEVAAVALGPQARSNPIVTAVAAGITSMGFADIRISPTIGVVAVGGPVKVFYPEVGRRLGCEMIFPPHCEVANAVGAATGIVARTAQVTIELNEGGGFVVHTPSGVLVCQSGPDALILAEQLANDHAVELALGSGAHQPTVRTSITKHHLPGTADDHLLFSALIIAEAIGIPALTKVVESDEQS